MSQSWKLSRPYVWAGLLSMLCVLGAGFPAPLSGTGVVWAADHEGPEGEAHPVEGPITMKKQDVDLAIFTLITFGLFLFVLKKMAWKPMIEGLDKREGKIQAALSDAEHARIKAQKLLDDHQHKLDRVQDQVREILAEARRDADVTKNDIINTAQREAEASKNRALVEIQRAKDAALDELFDQMSGTVAKATQQVVGRSLTGADHERLIREALQEFSSRKA